MYEYDVNLCHHTFDDEWLAKYEVLEESASINECLEKNGALNHDFRPVWPGSRACGRALTVLCRPGDNLIIHKAITMIKPGDILVITCDGFQETGGMFGGIMSTTAQKFGARGLIIDGAVRDTMMMKEIKFPVWSRGICVKKSTKLTPGKINVPIVIGGVSVNPGDMVFADNDSVVIIPADEVPVAYSRIKAREDFEDKKRVLVSTDPKESTFNDDFKKSYRRLELREEPGTETVY